MIIFLYGKDSYRLRQKMKEMVGEYQKKHKTGLSLKFFDVSDKKTELISFRDLSDEIGQNSLFKEKKFLVIKGIFSDADFKEKFQKAAKNFLKSEDIILLVQEGEVKTSDELFKFLKKNAKCQEFALLSGQKLKAWIKNELEKYKAKPEIGAIEKLIDFIGNDLWRLSNEIRKLVNFNKGKVAIKDIELLVRSNIETDIFRTIDAIAENNKKQALNLLQRHLEKGDSSLYLLSMICYQFRNLLIIKELIERQKPYQIILAKSGLHPFVVKKSYFQSQKFDFPQLKKIYQKIFQVDLDIKTGKVEPEAALELLIAGI